MKKRTINAILTGFMIVLVITIIILCAKIAVREPASTASENAVQAAISENIAIAEAAEEAEVVEEEKEEIKPSVLVVFPITTSNINVRSGPSVEDERVGAAYANTAYEVIEVLACGWTKVKYEGYEAYMSSELLDFQLQTEMGEGSYTYSMPTEEDIPYEAGAASVLK